MTLTAQQSENPTGPTAAWAGLVPPRVTQSREDESGHSGVAGCAGEHHGNASSSQACGKLSGASPTHSCVYIHHVCAMFACPPQLQKAGPTGEHARQEKMKTKPNGCKTRWPSSPLWEARRPPVAGATAAAWARQAPQPEGGHSRQVTAGEGDNWRKRNGTAP